MSKLIEVNGVEVELRKHHFSKQLKLSVRAGRALVTLPKWTPYRAAENFALSRAAWIQQQSRQSRPLRSPTKTEREQARSWVRLKLEHWSSQMGIEWHKLRIGNQVSRWGSCSSSGTLSFNWRAANLPEPLLDYLVIHELAHRAHPNHSSRFWRLVAQFDADYRDSRMRLKQIDFTEVEG